MGAGGIGGIVAGIAVVAAIGAAAAFQVAKAKKAKAAAPKLLRVNPVANKAIVAQQAHATIPTTNTIQLSMHAAPAQHMSVQREKVAMGLQYAKGAAVSRAAAAAYPGARAALTSVHVGSNAPSLNRANNPNMYAADSGNRAADLRTFEATRARVPTRAPTTNPITKAAQKATLTRFTNIELQ
jgi:hypothetical protein